MNFLKSFLEKIKPKLDIWLFYGFLLTFTLSIRKVLAYFPIGETFNEYSGIYLYISDIFLFLTLITWQIYILSNKSISLSSIKLWISGFFHNLYIFLPFIFVAWSFFSIIWSQNQAIALFRSIKLLELYFLYIYIIFRIVPRPPAMKYCLFRSHQECSSENLVSQSLKAVAFRAGGTISMAKKDIPTGYSTPAPLVSDVPRGTSDNFAGWNNLSLIIIGLGFLHSFLGLIQFIKQKSIDLFFLKESLIGPDIPGVAKVILSGDIYVRSYGLFPHPNILGGFLIVSIIFTLLYLKLFHVEQLGVKRNKKLFLRVVLLVQILVLLLTFSKSAILGLIIGLSYLYWNLIVPPARSATQESLKNENWLIKDDDSTDKNSNFVAGGRGTIRSWRQDKLMTVKYFTKKLFHVEQLRIFIPATLILSVSLFFIFKPNLSSFFIQSLNERLIYLDVSRGIILENPIFGLGAGQFVPNMQDFAQVTLQSWQYQPVHNMFILIWTELGFIGTALFIWILKLMLLAKKSIARRNQNIEDASGLSRETKMFHVEHFGFLRDGTIISIYFKAILIGLIFTSFFDHYLWSIQQGEILLWIILGLIAGTIGMQLQSKGKLST